MSLNALISIDSYGWIERFTNGPKAPQYNQIIESTEPKNIVTSIVVLYEVYKKIKKLKSEEEALSNSCPESNYNCAYRPNNSA
jgi:predicted nucleic acid-binding protein